MSSPPASTNRPAQPPSSPPISVVLLCYNHGHYLPTALEAVLKQEGVDFEVIVVNDGSTDKTQEILEDYQTRHTNLRILRHEKNQGIYTSVNDGIAIARGDYVYLAAADDEIKPEFLRKSLQLLQTHPQADLCCCIGDWREKQSGLNWYMGNKMTTTPAYFTPEEVVRLGQSGRLYIASHTVLIRRSAFNSSGGYIPELRWYTDWFPIHIAAFQNGLCVLPEALTIFNINEGSHYKADSRNQKLQRNVLTHLLRHLNNPQFAVAANRIYATGIMAVFGWPMLRLFLTHTAYWKHLNWSFLRQSALRIGSLQLKRTLPQPLVQLLMRLAGLQQPTPK